MRQPDDGQREPSDLHFEGIDAQIRALRAGTRRAAWRGAIGFAVAVVVILVWREVGGDVGRFVRGEVDLDGRPRYEPPHEPDPAALDAIDFERVHTREIPRWTVALSRADSGYWERRADEVFYDLAHEVKPDPNLLSLLSRTHFALRDHDPLEHAERMDYWLWAYNAYLDEQGVPWRLEATLRLGDERPVLFTRSYEILADARTQTGHRLRLLRRADRMNQLEGWMGRTGRSEDGAMVLMRRVLHFAVRHVWPALRPALDVRRPEAERSWVPFVREEVAASMMPDAFELLAETAEDQQALIEVAAAVEARVRACDGQLRFEGLPYNGLSQRSVTAIHAALARSELRPGCPEITRGEAAVIVSASQRLAETPGIETALEELALVVAGSVAVHELRHVADGDALECPGCPEAVVGIARDEVSAYLSAFSTEGYGYLALLQACAAGDRGGVHAAARQGVIDAILPFGCEGPPLYGLYDVAERVERRLFGEREEVSLPDDLPRRVRLLPRRQHLAARSRVQSEALESGWGMRLRRPETTSAAEPSPSPSP